MDNAISVESLLGHFRCRRRPRLAGTTEGPRGGGRERDEIVRHANGAEIYEFAPKVGVKVPLETRQDPDKLRDYREAFCTGIRLFNARGVTAGSVGKWPVRFLIRRCAWQCSTTRGRWRIGTSPAAPDRTRRVRLTLRDLAIQRHLEQPHCGDTVGRQGSLLGSRRSGVPIRSPRPSRRANGETEPRAGVPPPRKVQNLWITLLPSDACTT
jgi:hypothetical protein